MAKSTGNLTLVGDLLRDYPPAAVRLLILDRAWHAPWDYEPAALDTAALTLEDLYTAAGRPTTSSGATEAVTAVLLNDLDVPRAVAIARDAGGEAARLLIRVLALA